jgi:hypothetical protein
MSKIQLITNKIRLNRLGNVLTIMNSNIQSNMNIHK